MTTTSRMTTRLMCSTAEEEGENDEKYNSTLFG